MNIYRAFYLGLMLLLFSSCGVEEAYEESAVTPKKLIPKETFVSMLTEITLLEVYVSNNQPRTDPPFKIFRRYEMGIWEKFKVDSTQYFENFEYYYGNAKTAEYINIMLMDSLQKRRDFYFKNDTAKSKDERVNR